MIIYLHIPHTCGRSIKRFLFNKDELKKICWVHNPLQIQNSKITNIDVKYFILRDPIERIIGEFKHYSRNLKSIGVVNHLDLNNLLKENKNFDVNSILDYCSLEVNINICCKFLLLKNDFNVPVSENEFTTLLNSNSNNDFNFDIYSFPQKLPVLSSLLGFEIEPCVIVNNIDKNEILTDLEKIKKIKQMNYYDICLYNYLISKKRNLQEI